MKFFKRMIIFVVFLLLSLSSSVNAADSCERYWDELVGQCFTTTVDGTEYTACFSDSGFGPCPGGRAVLSYIDIQIIDGMEYEALIEVEFGYLTNYSYVTVAGLDFVLVNGRLILLPQDPLIFEQRLIE